MARLIAKERADSIGGDEFDFEVYPFFNLHLRRNIKAGSRGKIYWRAGNQKGNQLLSFDIHKDSGLITGVSLIAFKGSLSEFQPLSIPQESGDWSFELVRENSEDEAAASAIVDATDFVHDISFSTSEGRLRLGFFDRPPVKRVQISTCLSVLLDAKYFAVGIEIENIPASEIKRMISNLAPT